MQKQKPLCEDEDLSEQQISIFMKEAMKQAEKAIQQQEVPVGCVFITKQSQYAQWQIIARSHNLTNKYKNATRHCQINCMHQMEKINLSQTQRKHLILFVTVEPCIMCSYALNIYKIKHCYFGQFNDKFGGCGSVMSCNQYGFTGGIMENQSYQLIKGFYQRGNQRLSEQMRNKKRVNKNKQKLIIEKENE